MISTVDRVLKIEADYLNILIRKTVVTLADQIKWIRINSHNGLWLVPRHLEGIVFLKGECDGNRYWCFAHSLPAPSVRHPHQSSGIQNGTNPRVPQCPHPSPEACRHLSNTHKALYCNYKEDVSTGNPCYRSYSATATIAKIAAFIPGGSLSQA